MRRAKTMKPTESSCYGDASRRGLQDRSQTSATDFTKVSTPQHREARVSVRRDPSEPPPSREHPAASPRPGSPGNVPNEPWQGLAPRPARVRH